MDIADRVRGSRFRAYGISAAGGTTLRPLGDRDGVNLMERTRGAFR